MKTLVLLLALLAPGAVLAQAESATTSREVGQLFTALENSGCDFNRNGTWYDAHKASAHLHDKYEYLRNHGGVNSAESFIDLAASKSSMSGKPYLVRCGKAEPVESKAWFTKALGELRRKPASAASPKAVP